MLECPVEWSCTLHEQHKIGATSFNAFVVPGWRHRAVAKEGPTDQRSSSSYGSASDSTVERKNVAAFVKLL